MNKDFRKLSIILILSVFSLGFLFIINLSFVNKSKASQYKEIENNLNLKPSGTYENITIDNFPGSWNDWEWAESQIWCSGLGTQQNPYIIQSHTFGIDNSLDGIRISNSHEIYFKIENCTFIWDGFMRTGTERGIYLTNSTKGTIINNILYDTSNGMQIYNCEDTNVANNTIYSTMGGISLYQTNSSEVYDNRVHNTENGISLYDSEDNLLSKNIVYNNEYGLYITHSDDNDVYGNSANDNNIAGIYLAYSDDNNITENSASGNNDGLFLEDDCDYNYITKNNFNSNQEGILLYYSNFNNVSNNIAKSNTYSGIILEGSNNNILLDNNLYNNTDYGIIFTVQSNLNSFVENTVESNGDIGVYIIDLDCENNSIFGNRFLKNGLHAYDDGVNNKWNSTIIGNYWDNHTGPDENRDGIVDIPYNYIGGTAGSIDYLPIAEKIKSGGLDPGVIVVIVVVSVLGGLALIGAVLFFLDKKGRISLEKIKNISFRKK